MLLRLVPIFRQRCIIIYYCIGILLYIIAQLHSHVIFFQMERYSTASHADYHPFNVYDNDGVHLLRVHTLRQGYMDRGMLHCLYTLSSNDMGPQICYTLCTNVLYIKDI